MSISLDACRAMAWQKSGTSAQIWPLPISSENCRLDINQLEISKLKCIKTTHRFSMEFFCDPLCFEIGCNNKNNYSDVRSEWFRALYINKVGSVHITKERTYHYYTHWCKLYQYRAVRLQTFLEHLKLIDIEPSTVKKNLHNKKVSNCFTFCRDVIVSSIATFYQCGEEMVKEKMDWCICDTTELKRIKSYKFGGVDNLFVQ